MGSQAGRSGSGRANRDRQQSTYPMPRPYPTLARQTPFSKGHRSIQPLRWLLPLGLAFLATGCLDEATPDTWVLQEASIRRLTNEAEDPKAAQAAVSAAMESLFGTAQGPHWPMVDPAAPAMQSLVETADLYREECSHCHGLEGYGNGPSSAFIQPKPWNFSLGVFPRTAPGGGEPKLDALVQLFRDGIPAAAMPKFGRLGDERLANLAGYVLLLTQRGRVEPLLVTAYLEGGADAIEGEAAFTIFEEMRQAYSGAGSGQSSPEGSQPETGEGSPEGPQSTEGESQ